MTVKEIKSEIRETKREMKEYGIRKISCMNGGLSNAEFRYNARLFALKVQLADAEKAERESKAADLG